LDNYPPILISELTLNENMDNFYYEYLQHKQLNNLTFLKINKYVYIEKDIGASICSLKNLEILYLPVCDSENIIIDIVNNCKKLYLYDRLKYIPKKIIEIMNIRKEHVYYHNDFRFKLHPSINKDIDNNNINKDWPLYDWNNDYM
jgi:hypothetical protein